jgi:hypothetical protein
MNAVRPVVSRLVGLITDIASKAPEPLHIPALTSGIALILTINFCV